MNQSPFWTSSRNCKSDILHAPLELGMEIQRRQCNSTGLCKRLGRPVCALQTYSMNMTHVHQRKYIVMPGVHAQLMLCRV